MRVRVPLRALTKGVSMRQETKLLMAGVSIGFFFGYGLKAYLHRSMIDGFNKDWIEIEQRVTLHMSMISKIVDSLENESIDELQNMWNEHIDFMEAIPRL
jgi:hypothetical protein